MLLHGECLRGRLAEMTSHQVVLRMSVIDLIYVGERVLLPGCRFGSSALMHHRVDV